MSMSSLMEMYRNVLHIMTTYLTFLHVKTYAMNLCLNVVRGETIQQRPILIHFDQHDISN